MTAILRPATLLLATLAATAAIPAHAGTPVVRVDASATGANDGSSWADAYTRLDVALAAAPGGELWLAEGVYVPQPNPVGDRRETWFTVPPGTRIYGGFAGNELVREARDPLVNRTVLSGDLDGDDDADAHGIVQHPDGLVGSNAMHVVMFDADAAGLPIGPSTRLDGVVVTAGNAQGGGIPLTWGGGARCVAGEGNLGCSPTIANVEFRGNAALDRAGAWIAHGGGATSQPVFENVLFRHNATGGAGGAVFVDGLHGPRTVRMQDVRFEGNVAGTGGAVGVDTGADVTIDRAWFLGNRAQAEDMFFADGGALHLYGGYSGGSTLRVSNAVFQGNSATGQGGVAYTMSDGGDAVLELVNASASGNSAHQGGVLFNSGTPEVVARIRNSLLWGNTATDPDHPGGHTVYGEDYGYNVPTGHRVEIASSLLEHGLAGPGIVYAEGAAFPAGFLVNGGGNLAADPLFASGGTLRVRAGSPAIDAGNDAFNATPLDVAGLARRFDGDGNGTARIDIGAHEFGADGLFADGFED